MEPALALEWLSRQGHHVIKTDSSFWCDMAPKVFQAFPYHQLITPSGDELQNFFRQTKAIAVRYSTPLDQPEGKLSYHVVYNQNEYKLDNLPKKARHDVTKGLRYASYEPISVRRLATEGWKLRQETLIRQRRQKAESRMFWERLCLSADGLPCCEAWGALHEGELVAALFACTFDDTVDILYQQSLTQHLQFGINNALAYVFTHEALQRRGIKSIFYGLQSLDASPGVDEFKFRMKFLPRPVRQRVVFNPLIRPFIHPLSYRLLKMFRELLPANKLTAKAEGMVRFYLQGKRSLCTQEWPDVMRNERESILALAS